MIRKSVKSLQNRLNEFTKDLDKKNVTITAGAFTKARKKLDYTAFIELNKEAVIETMYEDEDYKKYKGFRLCAIDGSKIKLPKEKEIEEYFGTVPHQNQHNSKGEVPFATISVLYDVLNDIAIDSQIEKWNLNEVKLADKNIASASQQDLVIFDRGYASYPFLANLIQKNINFLVRCPRSSFVPVRKMFSQKVKGRIVTIKPNFHQKKVVQSQNLPEEIKIRLVRVVLDNGEIEVLATSLTDLKKYPYREFKDLYWLRWSIETFFDRIKNRLDFEHFTGKTSLSIKQDFYSTIYVTGLESILTQDAQSILDSKKAKRPYKVNRSITFNNIKTYVIELLLSDRDSELIIDELTQLFLSAPTCVRKNRSRPRETTIRRQANYYKRKRKNVY